MKILLIEDDLAECNEFEKSVQDFENITICAMTNNATDALSLTKYHLPDVVILDLELHMGGGNGLEYLSDLKQLNLVHRPLVIVTTNNTSKIVLDTARDLGAAMILTKYEQDYSATYVLKTISLMQNTLKSKRQILRLG
ncbi:MAG: DNA-binding response regulator [Pseudobutyrivibrio sp.]|nr:DNA-binding response regulator [Pseudobutyrivibrio sp.]